ncbi:PD-(D/E)XK nuclease family protein [Candidatus Sumerlaeota bacterium]|nr:PD-(D/E)XK nuclease family protein [Candidatus Sumerlaeota bacterium]
MSVATKPKTLERIFPLSFSAITLYQRCPFAFWCLRSEKHRPRPSKYSIIGTAVHEFIARYLVGLTDTGAEGQFFPTDFALAESLLPQILAGVPSPLREDVRSQCVNFYTAFTLEGPAYAEVHVASDDKLTKAILLDSDLYPPEGSLLHGVIDLLIPVLDGATVRIFDFKTGHRIYSQKEVESHPQLQIYALLSLLLYPQAEKAEINIWFVRYSAVRSAVIYRGELEDLRKQFLAVADRIINEKEFPPIPSSQCSRCDFYEECPEYQRTIRLETAIPPILSEEDAIRLDGEYRMLKHRLKQIEEALRNYAETNGPIETPDGKRGFFEEERKDYGAVTREICEILAGEGIPKSSVWQILTTSKTAVMDLLRKFKLTGVWKEKIEPIIPTQKVTKFKTVKSK